MEASGVTISMLAGFSRRARHLGLQAEQVRLLRKQLRVQRQWSPLRLLRDADYMQQFSRSMMSAARHSKMRAALIEYIQFQLFQINRIVATAAAANAVGGSTRQLRTDTELVVQRQDKSEIVCFVANRTKAGLWLSAPAAVAGQPVEWTTGERIQVKLRTGVYGSLAFTTRVKNILPDEHRHLLMVAHNEQIARASARRFPRREINNPIHFWPVVVMEFGRGHKKQQRAAINDESRRTGVMYDLSAGGCSIDSRKPLKVDTLIKIGFSLRQSGEMITAFGRVRRIIKDTGSVKRMAIEFTRLSNADHNQIQLYVYNMQ